MERGKQREYRASLDEPSKGTGCNVWALASAQYPLDHGLYNRRQPFF